MIAYLYQQYQVCPQQAAACQLQFDKGNHSQSNHRAKLQGLQTTSKKSSQSQEASQPDSCFARRTESLPLSSCPLHKLCGSSQYPLASSTTQVFAHLLTAVGRLAQLHMKTHELPQCTDPCGNSQSTCHRSLYCCACHDRCVLSYQVIQVELKSTHFTLWCGLTTR